MTLSILKGTGDIVLLNAAAAIVAGGKAGHSSGTCSSSRIYRLRTGVGEIGRVKGEIK